MTPLTATAIFALQWLKSNRLNACDECRSVIKGFRGDEILEEDQLLDKTLQIFSQLLLWHLCFSAFACHAVLKPQQEVHHELCLQVEVGAHYSVGSRSLRLLTGTQEMCLTWVNISCSCRSMSLLADPSDLCSSMREKCSMLLMDSFSCRVKITSLNTDRWVRGLGGGDTVNVLWRLRRHGSCAGK